jgi:hypothetical protein
MMPAQDYPVGHMGYPPPPKKRGEKMPAASGMGCPALFSRASGSTAAGYKPPVAPLGLPLAQTPPAS